MQGEWSKNPVFPGDSCKFRITVQPLWKSSGTRYRLRDGPCGPENQLSPSPHPSWNGCSYWFLPPRLQPAPSALPRAEALSSAACPHRVLNRARCTCLVSAGKCRYLTPCSVQLADFPLSGAQPPNSLLTGKEAKNRKEVTENTGEKKWRKGARKRSGGKERGKGAEQGLSKQGGEKSHCEPAWEVPADFPKTPGEIESTLQACSFVDIKKIQFLS